MSETKLELLRRLPRYIMLGHGQYDQNPGRFVVPRDTVFIFVSKASRYLPQSIVTRDFYRYFEDPTLSRHEPPVLQGWRQRIYGPGDVIDDIQIQFQDPLWPGMGIHKLPLKKDSDVFHRTPGELNGRTGFLSGLQKPAGVYFVVSCRAIEGQASRYNNQAVEYLFANGSTHDRIQTQNKITSRLKKRRVSHVSLRKPVTEGSAPKKRKVSRAGPGLGVVIRKRTVAASTKKRSAAPTSNEPASNRQKISGQGR